MTDKSPRKERTFGEAWNDANRRFGGNTIKPMRPLAVSSVNPDMPALERGGVDVKNLPSEN